MMRPCVGTELCWNNWLFRFFCCLKFVKRMQDLEIVEHVFCSLLDWTVFCIPFLYWTKMHSLYILKIKSHIFFIHVCCCRVIRCLHISCVCYVIVTKVVWFKLVFSSSGCICPASSSCCGCQKLRIFFTG